MAKKLFVRFSQPQDEKKIFEFYADNPHNFVFQRDPAVWKERISSGSVTLIEDEQGKIVASSISYPVTRKDAKGEDHHVWTEIGSTRVSLGGIGLFDPLMSAQVLRAWLLEPPEDRFALEIVRGNEHSKHVFTKSGATLFDIPPEMQAKVSATIKPGQGQNVEWFQMGVETIPQFARTLLDGVKNPKLVNKKTGEEYELDFRKCVLTTVFRPLIDKLAQSNYGDMAHPDLKQGIKSSRDRFAP